MTIIPTDEDHPDFTRPSQFTSVPIINTATTATSAGVVVGSFYTGGYESLIVRAHNMQVSVGWIYTLAWYADSTFATLLGQTNLRTVSVIPITAQIPNRGAWCRVTVTTNTVAAKTFELQVLPRTGTPTGAGAFLDGLIHGSGGQVIGPGASFTQVAFGLTPGEASLSVATDAVSWNAKLFGLDELAAVIGAFGGLNSTGGPAQTQRVILPPYWTELVVSNGDGVNRTFDWSVQAAY